MSKSPDTMDPDDRHKLAQRLTRLTGTPTALCLPRYQAASQEMERSPTFRTAERRFAALSDRKRLLAVFLLHRRRELCACEIQAATGLTHSGVSYHMALLVRSGLVESHRRGKWVHYRLSKEGEKCLREWP